MTTTTALAQGRIVKVAGPVVDVEFPPDALPEITYALEVDISLGGSETTVVCETAQHLGGNKVRAIALAPTDGLLDGRVEEFEIPAAEGRHMLVVRVVDRQHNRATAGAVEE